MYAAIRQFFLRSKLEVEDEVSKGQIHDARRGLDWSGFDVMGLY